MEKSFETNKNSLAYFPVVMYNNRVVDQTVPIQEHYSSKYGGGEM